MTKRGKIETLDAPHHVGSKSGLHSECTIETQATEDIEFVAWAKAYANSAVSDDSTYLFDLIHSLDKQEKELTAIQSEVRTIMDETNELFHEYKISIKAMKVRLADRKNKLKKLKL